MSFNKVLKLNINLVTEKLAFWGGVLVLTISLGCNESSFDSQQKKSKKTEPQPADAAGTDQDEIDETGTTVEDGGDPTSIDPSISEETPTSVNAPDAPNSETPAEQKAEQKPDEAQPDIPDKTIAPLDEEARKKYMMTHNLKTISSHEAWQVIRNPGQVVLYGLEEGKEVTKKTWTFTARGTGARTYVLEGGFLFTLNGGHWHFIDPVGTPEGAIPAANMHLHAGTPGAARTCVVSYLRDGKRYIGGGFGAGKFVEFALEDKAPFRPIWTATREIDLGKSGNAWGYSCHIDQDRLIYYGSWIRTAPIGLDLKTMKEVDAKETAPNGKFVSDNLANFTTGSGSYALSGDKSGNFYTAPSRYTSTHNASTDTIWVTPNGGDGLVWVIARNCLTKDKVCPEKSFYKYNPRLAPPAGIGMSIGPISSLRDGRVIAHSRGNGSIFSLELVDAQDFSKGVKATLLGRTPGDPYMYTDFTGATLYVDKGGEVIFNFGENPNFVKDKVVKILSFHWKEKDQKPKDLTDAKVQIRCYKTGDQPPEFEDIGQHKSAGVEAFITADQCRKKVFDHAHVRLIQENGKKTLLDVEDIHINFYQ